MKIKTFVILRLIVKLHYLICHPDELANAVQELKEKIENENG